MFFKIFVLCVIVRGSVSQNLKEGEGEESECSFDQDLYKLFASKTSYSVIKEELSADETKPTGCVPMKFWLLSRHGAEYPSEIIMKELGKLTTVRPDSVCTELTGWNLKEDNEALYDSLSAEGSTELSTLATRYKDRFPELFATVGNFFCQYAAEKQTNESYEAFVEALFPDDWKDVNVAVDVEDDKMLKFYEHCDQWQENNKTEDEADSESSKFETSTKFNEIIDNIKQKLGLTDIGIKDVIKIWDMCRYNRAWNSTENYISPWCVAFEKEDIEVLEYREDLKSYYKTGYGNGINSRLACKTVADMLHHLENTTSTHKVIAYFADELTIQLFLTALEVAKGDVKLSANNFDDMKERKWRLSEISPYASNLAVDRYDCGENADAKVKFFLNEKPLKVCSTNFCTLDDVLKKYEWFKTANCENDYCSGKAKIVYGAFYIVLALI